MRIDRKGDQWRPLSFGRGGPGGCDAQSVHWVDLGSPIIPWFADPRPGDSTIVLLYAGGCGAPPIFDHADVIESNTSVIITLHTKRAAASDGCPSIAYPASHTLRLKEALRTRELRDGYFAPPAAPIKSHVPS